MEAFAGFFFIIGCIMLAVFYVMLYLPVALVLWVIRRLRRWWKTRKKVKEIQKMLTQPEVQQELEDGITDGMVAELKRVGLDPANFNLNRPGVDFVPPRSWPKKFRKVVRWALAIMGLPIAIGFFSGMLRSLK